MRQIGHAIKAAAAAVAIVLSSAPAFAQMDLNGGWQSLTHEDWIERLPGSDLADYTGLPLSEAGRAEALSYQQAELSMLERQCYYYPPQYVVTGPQSIRIWSEADPLRGTVVSWNISAAGDRDVVNIWMDGRPRPSEYAPHEFSGFTTGKWEGDTLTAYTTHLKHGYERRNGVPTSDQATLTWHIFRRDELLTVMVLVNDPIYLTEPHVITRTWVLDTRSNLPTVVRPCFPNTEVPRLDAFGLVPHNLPDANPDIDAMTKKYNIPLDVTLGSAASMYPEYRKKLKDVYTAPDRCTRYCCGWIGLGEPGSAPGLTCITNGGGKPVVNPPRGF